MSLLLSMMTTDSLVHVSDAPGGVLRTALLKAPSFKALLSLAGPADAVGWFQEAAAERALTSPPTLAKHLADRASLRLGAADRAAALYTGWGWAEDGVAVSFRWRIGNFEDEREPPTATFDVDGTEMVPDPVKKKRPYSMQVATTVDLAAPIHGRIGQLPRLFQKRASASDVALEAAKIVSDATGSPALLVHLAPTGEVEAAVIEGAGVRPLGLDADQGLVRLR